MIRENTAETKTAPGQDPNVVTFPMSPRPRTEHDDYQIGLIKHYTAQMAEPGGQRPSLEELAGSCANQHSPIVRDWAVKQGICSESQWRKAARNAKLKWDLDTVPTTAMELVAAYTKKHRIEFRLDGMLERRGPMMFEDQVLSKQDVEEMPEFAETAHFTTPRELNVLEFERDLRLFCAEYKLVFSQLEISDAVGKVQEQAKRNILLELTHDIGHFVDRDNKDKADLAWRKLVEAAFVTSETSPEFCIAVLKKFMWQVKRKLRHMKVTDHLMPVLLGPQGVGKSSFVNAMLGMVRDITVGVDFKALEEERNIDIWDSYVMFLDEMGFASKANVDTIKNVITTEFLNRRPMRSNSSVKVRQNATFIGCSNKELGQLIKDPTGIRRFVGLRFRNKPEPGAVNTVDWDTINETDWKLLWQSVDRNGPDPMEPFKELLAAKQEEDREEGRVELWVNSLPASFAPSSSYPARGTGKSHRRIGSHELFEIYSEWESRFCPGPQRMGLIDWQKEMLRLEKNTNSFMFESGRKSSGEKVWGWDTARD